MSPNLYCYNAEKDCFAPIRNESHRALEFTLHAGTTDTKGTLYFPGNKGILCFNPSRMEKNTYIPPVYLTSLSINNNPVELGDTQSLRLKADETNIAIGTSI